MPKSNFALKTVLLFGTIPLIATAIAVRQAYLCSNYHLSTWKGGGMGMFASANSGDTRFARIYIETPDGARQPIVQLTPAQQDLETAALWYPTRQTFAHLARSLRRTTFVASSEPSRVYLFDAAGKQIRPLDKTHQLLRSHGQRPGGDTADWLLAIEYWVTTYDPATRQVKIELVDTLRFAKDDAG